MVSLVLQWTFIFSARCAGYFKIYILIYVFRENIPFKIEYLFYARNYPFKTAQKYLYLALILILHGSKSPGHFGGMGVWDHHSQIDIIF